VILSRDKNEFKKWIACPLWATVQYRKMALLSYALKGILLFGIIHLSSAVLPPYVGNGLPNTFQRNDIINHYFSLGLAFSEILAFLLCFHVIEISLRQLKRVLRRQGLHRRKDHSDIREIFYAIEDDLEGSGNSIVVSCTETTCVTADHVRPDRFPIYRAIISIYVDFIAR